MNVGFIGAGNMGGALAKGISKVSETNVYIYDKMSEKAAALAESIGAVASDFEEVVSESDFLFLGVKPNILHDVAEAVGKIANPNTVIVSMAAGVEIKSIEEALSKKLSIHLSLIIFAKSKALP